ncbi:hypothetical protein [Algoriphagus sp. AK58]|uniref:hypothetical protein n=1 Tax=Algoriphagus sp. AK58 TaxID=1406877 RepID=UPI00164FAF6F|nr:hypothetical protein [Algoriphagus sp. AK58]MBC6365675.1 hypothetical protein [Algoriphagus sp. AK58]
MSYFSFPRINFSGRFFTDPSTVNNDPTHYEVDNTRPSPWQNPKGLHRFQLRDCLVTSVIGTSGQVQDNLVGLPILTTDMPSPAKIVDLDVYQQGVPTIFGMEVEIPIDSSTRLKGKVDPAVLNHLWWLAVLPTRSWSDSDYGQDSFGGDMNACGFYQSIIRVKTQDWPKQGNSAALDELKTKTVQEDGYYLLSIRFIVDGYRNVPEDQHYQTGRILGALGPVYPNEPRYNPGVRWLQGREQVKTDPWYYPTFYKCPFFLDETRKMLVVDLANGICREKAGGGPVDLGDLSVWVKTKDGKHQLLGNLDYSEFCANTYSHIAELPIKSDWLELVRNNPILLKTSRTDIGDPEIFKEDPNAYQIEVEVRPVRMSGNPGAKAQVKAYVSQLGKPKAGVLLDCQVVSVHGNTPGATVPPSNPGNTMQAEGALMAQSQPTDANGFATITLVVLADPGFRTPLLDGQLYFINLRPQGTSQEFPVDQNAMISCLVWSQYQVNENPSWDEILRIFQGYVKLFPGMTEKVDLSDFHTFNIFSFNPPWSRGYNDPNPGPLGIQNGAIPYYLSREVTDPRYMPVTRDLSPEKILTVMHFIKNLQSGNSYSTPSSTQP